ncbi:MAG: hypothetical protein DMF81_02125 [Acidobacteria bacterium]|nr:MAG: hypothetical protein DMF81_02125 [Acidobacteriota bacterium]
MAPGAQHLALQGLDEVRVVEEAREAVGQRRAFRPLVDGDLDDLGVVQLAVHVDEVVEQRHPQAHVAAERGAQPFPMGLDAPPMPVCLGLGEAQVGEDREQARVERLSRAPVALEFSEELLLVGRVGLE